jgi:outer membrane protein TolC
MKHFVSTVLLLCFLATSGPGVLAQQQSQTPAVQTPDQFRGVDPATQVGQESIGDLKWFEVFKDPELQNLVSRAMQRN